MNPRRELFAFMVCLATLVIAFFHQTLLGGKILSPADVLFVSSSFRQPSTEEFEPANALLMDPVLQFQPWLEFNRAMIRAGRLPLWNDFAGCGGPHLANGQSAVFDPFHLIAYLGPTPAVYAWIAAARLFTAGLGMFLLARRWRLGCWGRWFAGLLYPFTGFLVLWLLYPVTNVAIWTPWLFWSSDRLLRHPSGRSAALLAIITAATIFGGHIQTSAHALMAVGLFVLWKTQPWRASRSRLLRLRRSLIWSAAIALGLAIAAVQILPLAVYLTRSPVWSDRKQDLVPWWSLQHPRLLDSICTALPYAFGSQRIGQPHLAPALGVHNLNESAGGYAGLAALLWLAPLAVVTCPHSRRVRFLAGLVSFALLAAYQIPPADNLLRLLPVLDVTDNRRLTLWVSFGLPLLAGVGLGHIERTSRLPRHWCASWVLFAALLGLIALAIPLFRSKLEQRATAHYTRAAWTTGSDLDTYLHRARRQVQKTVTFLPRYYGAVGCELAVLALLALYARRNPKASAPLVRLSLFAVTIVELGMFGCDVNPAIPVQIQTYEPPVISRLSQILAPGTRALGLGEELPPNVLMRFRLADPRNYDSVELSRSLDWFAPLYPDKPGARTSRRDMSWKRIADARDRLRESSVAAVVSAEPPPTNGFPSAEPVGNVWITRLDAQPLVNARFHGTAVQFSSDHGSVRILVDASEPDLLTIRITNTPGWNASIDGHSTPVSEKQGPFLLLPVPAGKHQVTLEYQPQEFVVGVWISLVAAVVTILVLTEIRRLWIPGIIQQGLGRTRAPELG